MLARPRASLFFAMLLLAAPASVRGDPVDPTPGFIADLQTAIRNDDKDWMADHLHLPVNYFGKTTQIIRSKAWFLEHYATVIGPELKANLLAQAPGAYFKNYQGVMIGDGAAISGPTISAMRVPASRRASRSSPSTIVRPTPIQRISKVAEQH